MGKAKPRLECLLYEITGSEQSIRDIVVVNGLPFYNSTGSSQDPSSIIDSKWRFDMWMPFAGLDPNPKVAPNPSQSPIPGEFSKLGKYIDSQERSDFKLKIKNKLDFMFNKLGSNKDILDGMLLKKNQNKNFTNNQILEDLTKQLVRFGTMEAMVISMEISPEPWKRNPLLKEFREQTLREYDYLIPTGAHFAVASARSKPNKSINLNTNLPANLKEHIFKDVNDWVLTEVKKDIHFENTSMNRAILSIASGWTAGALGALILQGVFDLGITGLVGAGLATVTAATGIGLIALAGVIIGVGCYLLWKSDQRDEALLKHHQSDPMRQKVTEFLKENTHEDITHSLSKDSILATNFYRGSLRSAQSSEDPLDADYVRSSKEM